MVDAMGLVVLWKTEAEKLSGRCVWLFGSFGGCTVSEEEGRGRVAWGVWSSEEQ